MADAKLAYGAATATAITCTLASLASSATAGREGTAIDNTTNKFLDALVQVSAKLAAGTPINDKAIYVYAYAATDHTSPTYTGGVTGSDAAYTMKDPTPLRLLGVIPCPDAGALTYDGGPWSVAAVFGGILPGKWGIFVRNFTGLALDSTEGNHKKLYVGVYGTVS